MEGILIIIIIIFLKCLHFGPYKLCPVRKISIFTEEYALGVHSYWFACRTSTRRRINLLEGYICCTMNFALRYYWKYFLKSDSYEVVCNTLRECGYLERSRLCLFLPTYTFLEILLPVNLTLHDNKYQGSWKYCNITLFLRSSLEILVTMV